jgi:hypothetical protein
MLTFVKKYGKDEFSQNGEDGMIQEIISRLGIEKGTVVEFGAHNGLYCSNSRALILQGWSAFLIEADDNLHRQLHGLYHQPSNIQFNRPSHKIHDVATLQQFVTPENVNSTLPANIDILSIDVDGIDYHIWNKYKGTAKVVIIEINSSLAPLSTLEGDKERGSSYGSMVLLGWGKGYTVLCHCGNLIFIRNDFAHLFPELQDKHPIRDVNEFFNTNWLPQ